MANRHPLLRIREKTYVLLSEVQAIEAGTVTDAMEGWRRHTTWFLLRGGGKVCSEGWDSEERRDQDLERFLGAWREYLAEAAQEGA